MRKLLAPLLALVLCLPVMAAQDGVVTFDAPNTGGAPAGYRLYRDGALLGTVTPGQSITALSPVDTGTIKIGVEAFNAAGATLVEQTFRIEKPLEPPGPVRGLTITLYCETLTPAGCVVTVVEAQ